MGRFVVIGGASAFAMAAAAYALTFLDDPGSMGRALATALGLSLTAVPTGVVAGAFSNGWKQAGGAAIASGGLQLAALTLYHVAFWKGSWDLPLIVGFAVLLQGAAMLATGGLVGFQRRRGKRSG